MPDIHGKPVNPVATIKHLGVKLILPRPIEADGQRRRSGWMLSCDGHIMAMFAEAEVEAVVAKIKKLVGKCDNAADFHAAIEETKGTTEFKLR